MHVIDAFLKSKAKFRGAIRKNKEHVYIYDSIRYFFIYKGTEREAQPQEVYGFFDWEPLTDKIK